MSETKAVFLDQSGAPAPAPTGRLWPALVVPKESIDAEIVRLAALPRPADGRRTSWIAHPSADPASPGLAPGIRVSLEVLLPGEETAPIRRNSTEVGFCIEGEGVLHVQGREIRYARYDVWNVPSMAVHAYRNAGRTRHARLAYSNAPLLEKLGVHVVDARPPAEAESAAPAARLAAPGALPPGTFRLTDEGAHLMPYETLIDPVAVESRALHFPWRAVKEHLDKLDALGERYRGRRLYLLYNPATGRTNGTTPSFFATMCLRPPGIVDRPHRHAAAAINYYFAGRGRSQVEGRVYEWKAGDLMLSAPGWAIHNHASYDEPVYELTIQDSPLHIAMESLLWHEDLAGPMRVLGASRGFETNRARLEEGGS
jgi:gentisate 1,2-dioxygenase